MNIAIIGSGVSGLLSAYLLRQEHKVTVFEAGDYLGGHTRTVRINLGEKIHTVDLGFLVYNEKNYPRFIQVLDRLGVHSQPCVAACSFRNDRTRLEFTDRSMAGFFVYPTNYFRPAVYAMLANLARFRRDAAKLLQARDISTNLRDFLNIHRYGHDFRENYLLPILSAVWCAEPNDPLATLAWHAFSVLDMHGFLTAHGRPAWRVIRGGSFRYIGKLTARFPDATRLNAPIASIRRELDRVWVKPRQGAPEAFDHVVVATHADHALALLEDPTDAEREILGGFPYRKNRVVLHTDTSMLPRRRGAWAGWNCYTPKVEKAAPTFTCLLSLLEQLDTPEPVCLTFNPSFAIDPAKIIGETVFEHPIFTWKGLAVQRRHGEISGPKRTHYCGAYWGHGTHEDAVKSAVTVAEAFGLHL